MTDQTLVAGALANRVAHTIHGIVSAVDPVNHAVKVMIQPENVESGWISDAAWAQSGDIRISCPSCVGTHVVLQPIEGDGEHLAVVGIVYDAVVLPPASPATGRVAQPGEILIMAGCGAPPIGANGPGTASASAPWWHLTRSGVFSGAGNARSALTTTGMTWSVGEISMTLTSAGLSISGGGITSSGDVVGQSHSLSTHVHALGQAETGTAIG
jgi:phage baseplate assembly protein gpV